MRCRDTWLCGSCVLVLCQVELDSLFASFWSCYFGISSLLHVCLFLIVWGGRTRRVQLGSGPLCGVTWMVGLLKFSPHKLFILFKFFYFQTIDWISKSRVSYQSSELPSGKRKKVFSLWFKTFSQTPWWDECHDWPRETKIFHITRYWDWFLHFLSD